MLLRQLSLPQQNNLGVELRSPHNMRNMVAENPRNTRKHFSRIAAQLNIFNPFNCFFFYFIRYKRTERDMFANTTIIP